MLSYYEVLQVKETATDAEIKQAYRNLSKILHPDLNGNTPEATTIFRSLKDAYETLSDPLKRKAYDHQPEISEEDELRIESYKKQNAKQSTKLSEYEDQLKEYKQAVFLKSERERKLLKEIHDLKEYQLEIEKRAIEKVKPDEKVQRTGKVVISEKPSGMSWFNIMVLILGANLIMFLSYFAFGKMFWFFFQ
ncbi:MAG: J domain-containing protein [Crocinitomicaceae bacterium]